MGKILVISSSWYICKRGKYVLEYGHEIGLDEEAPPNNLIFLSKKRLIWFDHEKNFNSESNCHALSNPDRKFRSKNDFPTPPNPDFKKKFRSKNNFYVPSWSMIQTCGTLLKH